MGSEVQIFLFRKAKQDSSINDPEMTRFNISLREGVDGALVFEEFLGGELFVPKIPSYQLLMLLKL